jgi:phosphate-selective porin
MKRIITLLLFVACTIYYGYSQNSMDSISESLDIHEGKLNALEERLLTDESELFKLTKIKVSGYIQGQFEVYQADSKTGDAWTSFYIRRARVKFSYQPTNGLVFVLQPDFSTGNLSLKDAYALAYLPKFTDLTLWVGQFNRPNYEVEYSSSQREVVERSRVIRALYPSEREVGAKLEYNSSKIPIKVQFAVLNGNFTGKEAKDIDAQKDLMGRITYSLNFPSAGIGIDFGAHGYYGGYIAQSKYVNTPENIMDSTASNKGSLLEKQWFGVEAQFYFDLLGGMSLKGEFIKGQNSTPGADLTLTNPYKQRNFTGYYAYFIKNIGKKNQFVTRYDYYDPNTDLSGDDAKKEVYYHTFNFAWQYYLNDNIRFTLNYEKPINETNATYAEDRKDDVFTVRVQAKF